jgi:hypothetical protein
MDGDLGDSIVGWFGVCLGWGLRAGYGFSCYGSGFD